MVTISGSSWYLDSANLFTQTTTPVWRAAQFQNGTWLLNTQPVNWSDNKTYTITVRARDAAGNEKTATSTFTKVVQLPKDPSTLTLDLSSNSIASNGTVTFSGILSRFCSSGACTPINLQNRPVKLTIRNDANSIIHQQDYTTSDPAGHYSSGPLGIFATSGSYTVQATYAGETDLQKSTSATKTLLVGKPAGYAVIIQGKIASGEGLAEHSKSTRRIYQALKERNFTDDNIYWFNYGTVTDPQTGTQLAVDDTTPTINEIGNIITGTAAFSGDGQTLAQRMNANPAPLYLIMVDHGSPDQFHLGDGDITPTTLDSWLTTLDTNITTSARSETKIIIIGACYSGSFIKQPLSKTGRIIITSASRGEVSYRGGFDGQDSVQSGEYFLDELFSSFKRLSDIKTAFSEASKKTWQFTRKGGIPNSNGPFTNAAQHPLLDDNGDGSGSIILSDGSGDGATSKGIYLGVSPGTVNSLADPADLSSVTPTIYLENNQTTNIPALWATAANPSQISTVYVELLRPINLLTASSGTGQISRPIDPAQVMTATSNRFEHTTFTYSDPGKHEAYYYAIDKETGAASPSKRSLIYRDKPGNNKPTAPTTIEPGNDGLVPDPANPATRTIPETTLQFQWNAATDQDNDPLTYTLEICTDNQLTTGCKTYEEIVSTTHIVEGLTATTTYYWRIWATDPYTKSATGSETRSFTPQSANPLLTIIRGQVISADTPSQVISGAQVTLKTAGYPDRIAVTKTDGTFAYLGIPLTSATFDFSLTATRSDYAPGTITVSLLPTGTSINQLIPLTAGTAPVTTTTKAKIYLGIDDTFTVSSSGATLYGNTGTDTVTITNVTTGITLDQNIEKINLPGTTTSYRFKQTGNKINIYDTSGTTQIVTVPVQGDTDGTILSFSDGTAAAQLTSGIMTLGGATVSATATALTPTLTANTPTPFTASKAKVFLGNDDIFTINSSGTTLYGSSGNDSVTIAAEVTNVTLDQNVERINLPGASTSYQFKQTGNKINIYDTTGITQLVTIPIQGDADGTQLSFSNGTASAMLTGGVMTVGGATVGSTVAGLVAPVLK
jgi:hypothetical protein